ncbi:MAG: hypothetical protein A2046_09715 [Bacteroidetes bacterium GWA2_30_7]|nr:MAG: hypothetical protein A2046_09715 [Bacteroidetes bacterium GWA2_30_7]
MIINDTQILQYIPQREPIVMIDTLVESDEVKTVSSLSINSENIFCKDGVLNMPGLIENMAQTAALRVGYYCKIENKPVPIGFIGGIKNLIINKLPITGSTITTEIFLKHEVMEASIVQCYIKQNEEIIAECELKIFLIKTDNLQH